MSTSPTRDRAQDSIETQDTALASRIGVAAVSQLTTGPFRKSPRAQGGSKDHPGHLPVFNCRVRLLRYLPVCNSRLCGTDPPEALLLLVFGVRLSIRSSRVPCRQYRADGVGMLLPIRRCGVVAGAGRSLHWVAPQHQA